MKLTTLLTLIFVSIANVSSANNDGLWAYLLLRERSSNGDSGTTSRRTREIPIEIKCSRDDSCRAEKSETQDVLEDLEQELRKKHMKMNFTVTNNYKGENVRKYEKTLKGMQDIYKKIKERVEKVDLSFLENYERFETPPTIIITTQEKIRDIKNRMKEEGYGNDILGILKEQEIIPTLDTGKLFYFKRNVNFSYYLKSQEEGIYIPMSATNGDSLRDRFFNFRIDSIIDQLNNFLGYINDLYKNNNRDEIVRDINDTLTQIHNAGATLQLETAYGSTYLPYIDSLVNESEILQLPIILHLKDKLEELSNSNNDEYKFLENNTFIISPFGNITIED